MRQTPKPVSVKVRAESTKAVASKWSSLNGEPADLTVVFIDAPLRRRTRAPTIARPTAMSRGAVLTSKARHLSIVTTAQNLCISVAHLAKAVAMSMMRLARIKLSFLRRKRTIRMRKTFSIDHLNTLRTWTR